MRIAIAAIILAGALSLIVWLSLRDINATLEQSIERSPVIVLAIPENSGRGTAWKVSQILKGPSESGHAWSIGSTRYSRVLQTRGSVEPQSQIVFLGPKFFVTGPLEPQQMYPVYDGKLPAFGITLTEFEAKIGVTK